MGFKEIADLDCEKAYQLGGTNKETGKPNPKSMEGYYIGAKDIASKFSKTGMAKLYILKTPKGNVGVYGKTDLDSKMVSVAPGTMIRITQTHSVPTAKGNDLIKFKVEVDSENTIEVNLPSVNEDNSDSDYSAVGNDQDYTSEAPVDEDDSSVDEAAPARATPPARAATAPSAAQQKKVQDDLLNRNRKGAAA